MNRITLWSANVLVFFTLIFLPTFQNGDWDLQDGSFTYRNSAMSEGYRFLGFSNPLSSGYAQLDVDTLMFEAIAICAILFWVSTVSSRTERSGKRSLVFGPVVGAILLTVFHPSQVWTPLGNHHGTMQWDGIGILFFERGLTVVDPRMLFIEFTVLFAVAAFLTKRIDRSIAAIATETSGGSQIASAPDDSPASHSPLSYLGLALR